MDELHESSAADYLSVINIDDISGYLLSMPDSQTTGVMDYVIAQIINYITTTTGIKINGSNGFKNVVEKRLAGPDLGFISDFDLLAMRKLLQVNHDKIDELIVNSKGSFEEPGKHVIDRLKEETKSTEKWIVWHMQD